MDWSRLPDLLKYSEDAPLLFNSGLFVYLFLIFIFFYGMLRNRPTLRIVYVILFSYYFYYKSSGEHFWLLMFTTVVDFSLARLMAQTPRQRLRKLYVALSLCANLGMLGYFKYTNFLGEIFGALINQPFQGFNIALPVGISFFTFQSLSYTIDVYRGNIKPLRNMLDYAFYISFFPPLVAGPIVRAKDFIPQIRKPVFVSREMFGRAVFLIAAGLFKKAVVSNYIGVNFVDRIFDNPSLYSGLENLFGLYGYAVQIYCDFSGYSDMAIGIALMLGFHLNVNFDSPYKSQNITEFWHRWHISLSSWLRDYLYISLGGNRKGKLRMYLNLLITMLLGGLWHGASLRYLLWGAIHGVSLALHKLYHAVFPQYPTGWQPPRWRRAVNVLITFHLVLFGWLFFRAPSMEVAGEWLSRVFTAFHPEILFDFVRGYAFVLLLMAIAMLLHFAPDKLEARAQSLVVRMPLVAQALVLVALAVIIFQLQSGEVQPFIYFRY